GAEAAAIPEAVTVFHRPGQDVGDRLDAAMRVPRKPRKVVGGPIVSEIIEQQKWIELGRLAESERTLQLDAGAFQRRRRGENLFDGTNGHDVFLPSKRILFDVRRHAATACSGLRRTARFIAPPA